MKTLKNKKGQYKKLDIIVYNNKIEQIIFIDSNSAVIQDIYCREQMILVSLIDRKATKVETKWFCEVTENMYFKAPKP